MSIWKSSQDGEAGPQGPQGIQGIQGVAGNPGSNGVDGVRGSVWTTGSGAPSASANAGDMYLDTSTGNVWRMN